MKNFKAYTLSISVLPLLALLLLVPADSNEQFSEEALLPSPDPCSDPIVAVNSSGPNTCFVRGTFVDFHDLFGPSNVTGANWEWTSSPSLPGFDTFTGQRLLRTYYIPTTVTPDCYTITVEDASISTPCGPGSGPRKVTIRILANASDPCDECETLGGGGPGE